MGRGGVSRGRSEVLRYSIRQTETGGKVLAVGSMIILNIPRNMVYAWDEQGSIGGTGYFQKGNSGKLRGADGTRGTRSWYFLL